MVNILCISAVIRRFSGCQSLLIHQLIYFLKMLIDTKKGSKDKTIIKNIINLFFVIDKQTNTLAFTIILALLNLHTQHRINNKNPQRCLLQTSS